MTRASHRLPSWQHRLLIVVGGGALASGLAWLALHYGASAGADGLPSPAEAWLMKLHGLAGFGALFLLGALAAGHVPQGWRLSGRRRWARQRGTGVMLCVLTALLAASGYLLYYFAPETMRPALGWAHSAIGMAAAGVVLAHRRGQSAPTRSHPG